jgi:hypothetical protein
VVFIVDLVKALRIGDAHIRRDFSFYDGPSLSKAAEAVGRTKRMILNWVRGLGREVLRL